MTMVQGWYDSVWKSAYIKKEPSLMFGSKCIGYYSMNKLQTYLPNASKLTYYRPPYDENVFFELNKGLDWAVTRDYLHRDPKLLFKWIEFNSFMIPGPPGSDRWIDPDFVCSSGVLTTLLCSNTPADVWAIRAARSNGSIYLATCKRKFAHIFPSPPEDPESFPSWQYKFERYVVSDQVDQPPNPFKVVIEPDEFRCVYTTRFGEHTVLYDAPMKAARSHMELSHPLPKEDLDFILLRLVKQMTHDPEHSLSVPEIATWWALGHLTNSEEVLCGFRNDVGIVRTARTYNIRDIVERIRYTWKPLPCLNYCRWVLTRIASAVVNEDIVYEFEKIPNQPEITVLPLPISLRHTVIPESFMD